MNYPPGTSRRDLERAGIIEGPPIRCPQCDVVVSEGESHEDWCECELNQEEMAEYWAEQNMGAEKADRKEL
jgi:hypothetical protein